MFDLSFNFQAPVRSHLSLTPCLSWLSEARHGPASLGIPRRLRQICCRCLVNSGWRDRRCAACRTGASTRWTLSRATACQQTYPSPATTPAVRPTPHSQTGSRRPSLLLEDDVLAFGVVPGAVPRQLHLGAQSAAFSLDKACRPGSGPAWPRCRSMAEQLRCTQARGRTCLPCAHRMLWLRCPWCQPQPQAAQQGPSVRTPSTPSHAKHLRTTRQHCVLRCSAAWAGSSSKQALSRAPVTPFLSI